MPEVPLQRLLILGHGRSGKAAVNLALRIGAHPIVADEKEVAEDQRIAGVEYLQFMPKKTPFPAVDAVILSPGIHPASDFGRWARSHPAIPVWSELEFAARHATVPMLAITGTNGKTTTTELTVHILNALGIRALAAGNIGHALAQAVYDAMDAPLPPDYLVVEVSSFQLEAIDRFAPRTAVLLNITSDHIDRYASFEEYGNTKFNIFKNTSNALVNNELHQWFKRCHPNREPQYFSRKTDIGWQYDNHAIRYCGKTVVALPSTLAGLHNAQNLVAALMLISTVYPEWQTHLDEIQEAVDSFRLDAHRIETIAEYNGIRYVNDSKGTNPDAVTKAVECFAGDHNIHLLLGGLDKGMDFSLLRPLAPAIATAYLYGRCASTIENALHDVMPTVRVETLEQAVDAAWPKLRPGDTLLLSPACASMDQFKDYRERGDTFRQLTLSRLRT